MTLNIRKIILLFGFILLLTETVCGRPNPKICHKRNGKIPRPGTSCRGYYECKNYVPLEKTCGDGENFNANKGWCDWEDLYPCLEKKKDKECLRENGLFLKLGTNCKKYYRCCNGKAKVEACFGDLLFNPSKENCEWPDLYTCIENLSTTKKASSTVTVFATSTPPLEASTDPAISKSTIQKTTASNRIIYSTRDPDFEKTNSKILEISTNLDTQPTSDDKSTFQTSEASTISQTITSENSTTLEPKEVSITSEVPTSQSRITETSTLQSTTSEISNTQPTSESSTLRQTTSEISIISQTTSPEMSSTHSTDHTILKENKENETEPAIFETTMEITVSTSTVEVTTPAEENFMCPEPNGYFPHPTDKHKFVGCVDNIPHVLTCPSDLVYKHDLKRCDH